MRPTVAISSLSLVLGLAGGAFADPTPPSAPTPAAKPAKKPLSPDDMICTQEAVTGSIFPKKVCLTRAQRAKMEDENQGATATRHGNHGTVRTESP
jgi:hypothetical protein